MSRLVDEAYGLPGRRLRALGERPDALRPIGAPFKARAQEGAREIRKLSTGEFAQQVGLGQIRIRELARDGRITFARKEGGRWHFRPSSKSIPTYAIWSRTAASIRQKRPTTDPRNMVFASVKGIWGSPV